MTPLVGKGTKYKSVPVLMERWTNARMKRNKEPLHAKKQEQNCLNAVSTNPKYLTMRIKMVVKNKDFLPDQ